MERLRPGVPRRPRQELRRAAIGELAQVALAAERAGQPHAPPRHRSQIAARALIATVRDIQRESEDAYPHRCRVPRRALALGACGESAATRAATGGLGGAAVGTVLGGPVLGTAAGAAGGAAVGAATTPD